MGILDALPLPNVRLGGFIPSFNIFSDAKETEEAHTAARSKSIHRIPGGFEESGDERSVNNVQPSDGHADHESADRDLDDTLADGKQLSGPNSIRTTGSGTGRTDPLSMHILKRTGTDQLLSRRQSTAPASGSASAGETSNPSLPGILRRRTSNLTTDSAVDTTGNVNSSTDNRHRKKHVSFLSRLTGRDGKRRDESDSDGHGTNHNHEKNANKRSEGYDAAVFSRPMGYVPQLQESPKYIRMRSHGKVPKDFDRLFLAQELYRKAIPVEPESPPSATASTSSLPLPRHKSGAIWSIKFSEDGKYLATGGEDRIVRVWSVISTPEEREQYESEEEELPDPYAPDSASMHSHRPRANTRSRKQKLNAPVFRSNPHREFVGHKGDVLDLSWSRNNFLLSSSMDKTVRLWHVSREECLCCFQHQDFVTSIAFHPLDDRFFLSGSLDYRLRLWSIPDKTVVYWNDLSNYITAVSFTSDGQTAIAGCFTGQCFFYETEGLRYRTRMHVRSSRGRNANGAKITGIELMRKSPGSVSSDARLLITSNDSRVRLYNLRDKSLEAKLKGNENTFSQIKATSSEDGRYVICGSEDNRVYIWDMVAAKSGNSRKDKHPYEYFTAHSETVTEAVFAPMKTIQLLSQSGDPVYDLCRRPSVRLDAMDGGSDTAATSPRNPPMPHPDGNIIVTADQKGHIKIFRQDCAHKKRKETDEAAALSAKSAPRSSTSTTVSPSNSINSPGNPTTPRTSSRSTIRSSSTSNASRGLSRVGRRKSHEASPLTPTTNQSLPQALQPVSTIETVVRNDPSLAYYRDAIDPPTAPESVEYNLLSPPPRSFSQGFFSESDESENEDDMHTADELTCSRCGGQNFKASITARRETKLVCATCGLVAAA
ncbi:WD40-repeat-containing domain protein [Lipomyces kononenkoae]|uniref:WD40-repeat-containing domain protein n=1 Tax=Lipomyces kononenkoae TaxID=34357 RepID=A0ACC3T8V5_LIPKO